jgi:hypothetical protein
VLQDHGWGGNWDKFGRGGLLEKVAGQCSAFPEWLLVADNTEAWDGYVRVPDVAGSPGGRNRDNRFLYRRKWPDQPVSATRRGRPSNR